MNNRERRHKRIRKRVYGTESRPRLSVYRSSKHMFAQLINDDLRITIIGMSTLSLKDVDGKTKTEKARELGLELGAKILALGKYKKNCFLIVAVINITEESKLLLKVFERPG